MDLALHSASPRSGGDGATPAPPMAGAGEAANVVALHCSGAGAAQWRSLAEALGASRRLIAPEHFGCDSEGPWTGAHAFALADEAARTIALIDQADRPIHLVGYSYGGGVALYVALARPQRIASLALYEPSAFHVLRQIGPAGTKAFDEITDLARATGEDVAVGDFRSAAERFVDYWNGAGAWRAIRPAAQNAITRWMPKAPLDFNALIRERTPIGAYAALPMPTLLLRGEHAPTPTRIIAETLAMLMPDAALAVIAGAGHMGPLTHAAEVSARIVAHIDLAHARRGRMRTIPPPRRAV